MPYHNEYRRLWIDAGYPPDMGSACAVRPPPQQYLAVYHFTETEYAIAAITKRRMKLTHIFETNDPFEFEGLSTRNVGVRREIKEWKDEFNQKFGLLCFSKDWKSPALWAHYSFRHMGICLGFWAKRDTLHTVIYNTERADVAYKNRPKGLSAEMKEYLLTAKAQDWQYEEEIRRRVELSKTIESSESNKIRFFQFDDTLRLSEVILGAQCTKTVSDVRSLLHHQDVAVFKARPAFGFFKMVPDEKTIPK
jgi:hypothetical protein